MTGKDILDALNCLSEEELGGALESGKLAEAEAARGEAVAGKLADADFAGSEAVAGKLADADFARGEAVAGKPKRRHKGYWLRFAVAALLGVVLFGGGVVGGLALASESGISLKSLKTTQELSSFELNVKVERIAPEELGEKVRFAAADLREEILQKPEGERREYYGYMETFDKVADAEEYFGYAPLAGAPAGWQESEAMVILLENAEGALLRAELAAYYMVEGNRVSTNAAVYTEALTEDIVAGFAPTGEYVPYRAREYQTKDGKTAWFMALEGESGHIGGWFGYLLDEKILYEISISAPPYNLPPEFRHAANAEELYQERMWELLYEWADAI